MEQVVSKRNMSEAHKRILQNKGAAGVDGVKVQDLKPYLWEHWEHWERIKQELLEETYRPQPARRVEIPKPDGGIRLLGIPTIVDRLIQQSLLQVLNHIFDPSFSEFSFGFRPNRSARLLSRLSAKHPRIGPIRYSLVSGEPVDHGRESENRKSSSRRHPGEGRLALKSLSHNAFGMVRKEMAIRCRTYMQPSSGREGIQVEIKAAIDAIKSMLDSTGALLRIKPSGGAEFVIDEDCFFNLGLGDQDEFEEFRKILNKKIAVLVTVILNSDEKSFLRSMCEDEPEDEKNRIRAEFEEQLQLAREKLVTEQLRDEFFFKTKSAEQTLSTIGFSINDLVFDSSSHSCRERYARVSILISSTNVEFGNEAGRTLAKMFQISPGAQFQFSCTASDIDYLIKTLTSAKEQMEAK